MTTMDTIASVTFSSNLYCDNANMFFYEIEEGNKTELYSISGIVNSVIFSVLARSIANPQTNGYFKFNKQFLEPIPFPVSAFLSNTNLKEEISQISQAIEQLQGRYINSCLLYTSPSPRDATLSRMPSSA